MCARWFRFGETGDAVLVFNPFTDWDNCFDFTQVPLPPGMYTQPTTDDGMLAADTTRALDWSFGVEQIITGEVGGIEAYLERIFHLESLKPLDKRPDVYNTLRTLEQNVAVQKRIDALG